jgi:transposase
VSFSERTIFFQWPGQSDFVHGVWIVHGVVSLSQKGDRRVAIAYSPVRVRATYRSRRRAWSRYALWKNPDGLNTRQRHQLDWIAKTDPRLWRAYLLKEGLRYVFAVKGTEGKDALDRWLSWARRSRLESFVHLATRITNHREAIDANLEHGLSQGLIESTNTKIRLLTRIAFGFHGPQPLIALALLALGSHPPQLPGRT